MVEVSRDFRTAQELNDLLDQIGRRLHAKNRIAGGESVLLWYVAEALRAAGRLSLAEMEEPDLNDKFGNGYEAGSIPKKDHLNHFLALLKEEMPGMK